LPAAVAYLDSSALVKTVVREPESTALRRFLRSVSIHASSALATTEVLRAVRRADAAVTPRAQSVLGRVVILELTTDVLLEAGLLDPPELRTLDAIHLATAKTLGDDLAAVVTYDERMAAAAVRLGLPVETPTG
jgi:predicted nucleic acid-binding protein